MLRSHCRRRPSWTDQTSIVARFQDRKNGRRRSQWKRQFAVCVKLYRGASLVEMESRTASTWVSTPAERVCQCQMVLCYTSGWDRLRDWRWCPVVMLRVVNDLMESVTVDVTHRAQHVTSAPSLAVFGRRLKTELFRRRYNAVWLLSSLLL